MLRLLVSLLGLAGLWILFVAGIKPEEMIVGAICMPLTIVFSWYVANQCSMKIRLRTMDVLQAWYIPWYVVTGAWEIISVLVKDVLHIAPAESLFRATPYREDSEDPAVIGRRVLAVTYTTATPNFIIVGIDLKTRRMLFHQIKKSGVRTMTRRLGAQA